MNKLTPEEKAARKKVRVAQKRREELAAINNHRTRIPEKSSTYAPVSTSKRNRIGKQRRHKRYHQAV